MRQARLHITIFFMMLRSILYAQDYTNYSTKDGLPSNHVYRITQDRQGFIWFITDKGMVKYNGSSFKTFTTKDGLPTNDIWDIRITADNRVWYFSKSSKLGYIENDSVFAFESAIKNEILYPTTINQSGNDLSFSSSFKNYGLEGDKWVSMPKTKSSKYTLPLFHNKVKGLYINSNTDSLFVVANDNSILKAFDRPNQYKTDNYRGQINDSLFCVVNKKSYSLLNLNNLNKITYIFSFLKDSITSNFVRFNKVNNQIQFTGQGFVGILDKNYQVNNPILIPKKLKSHFSFIDRNYNLWIATNHKGVFFLPRAKRNTTYRLIDEKVGALQQVNGKIIANVYNEGFYQYVSDSKEFIPILKEKGFIYSANQIEALQAVYYNTNKKIIKIKNTVKTEYNFKSINVNETGRKLLFYKNNLYGNSTFGLNRIDSVSLAIIDSFPHTGIIDMLEIQDRLILATSSGLKELVEDKLKFIQINDSIFDKPILALVEKLSNEIVVCTDGFGAYTTDLREIELLEGSNFLSVQDAFIINNTIWLATNQGVWKYKKNEDKYKLVRKYTVNDGLISNVNNAVVIVENQMIASSNNGISIVPINHVQSNSFLAIYFDKVLYNNVVFSKDKQVNYSNNNHLEVDIATIDFSENPILNYQYQLLPVQKDWISTQSNTISYNNLEPNNYTLRIRFKDRTSSLNFEIKPLWHQTFIAKLLFVVMVLAIIVGLILWIRKRELKKQAIKLNTQKQLAEHELYALRSQMNPHFVFNSLNAIQYYLNDNKVHLSEKYLVKFSQLIRMFFEFSQQKEVKLSEEIVLLEHYLEIEKMRFGEKLSFKIIVESTLDLNRNIPTMLLQPIVENAVNHGLFHKKGNGLVQILFEKIDNASYRVVVEDNGIGREKSQEIQQQSFKTHKSKSTQIIHNRITLINTSNQCYITYKTEDLDKKNKSGTKVTLKFEIIS